MECKKMNSTASMNEILGRDKTVELDPTKCYRMVAKKTYYGYKLKRAIKTRKDEYVMGENNAGIDWYLGGVCARPRYGKGQVMLVTSANKDYFVPANNNGNGMSMNPNVKHMKSSPMKKPVSFKNVNALKVDFYKGKKGCQQALPDDEVKKKINDAKVLHKAKTYKIKNGNKDRSR